MRTISHVMVAASLLALSANAFAEKVDNPEYTAWAKYKPGACVIMKTTAKNPADIQPPEPPGDSEGLKTVKLLEVTPDKVVIESTLQILTKGKERELPATKLTIPAKIEKGDELFLPSTGSAFTNIPINNIKEGKEVLEVMGKKVETTTKEFTVLFSDGDAHETVNVKVWFSADSPGGIVKRQLTTTGAIESSNTSTLVDVKNTP